MPATLASKTVSLGTALTFEDLDASERRPRIRMSEQTLLRVVAGSVGLTVHGATRLLAAGEEAIIEAAASYTLESVGGPARVLTGFRPAPAR